MAQKILHLKQKEFMEIENLANKLGKSSEQLLLEIVREWMEKNICGCKE